MFEIIFATLLWLRVAPKEWPSVLEIEVVCCSLCLFHDLDTGSCTILQSLGIRTVIPLVLLSLPSDAAVTSYSLSFLSLGVSVTVLTVSLNCSLFPHCLFPTGVQVRSPGRRSLPTGWSPFIRQVFRRLTQSLVSVCSSRFLFTIPRVLKAGHLQPLPHHHLLPDDHRSQLELGFVAPGGLFVLLLVLLVPVRVVLHSLPLALALAAWALLGGPRRPAPRSPCKTTQHNKAEGGRASPYLSYQLIDT